MDVVRGKAHPQLEQPGVNQILNVLFFLRWSVTWYRGVTVFRAGSRTDETESVTVLTKTILEPITLLCISGIV